MQESYHMRKALKSDSRKCDLDTPQLNFLKVSQIPLLPKDVLVAVSAKALQRSKQ